MSCDGGSDRGQETRSDDSESEAQKGKQNYKLIRRLDLF